MFVSLKKHNIGDEDNLKEESKGTRAKRVIRYTCEREHWEKYEEEMVNGIIGQIAEFRGESDDWMIYQERLEQYFAANRITTEEIRVATLLSTIGTQAYKLLRDLSYPKLPKEKAFKELCALLKQQYSPHISEWRERIKFHNMRQETGESISEWYARVRGSSVNCNFGDQLMAVLKEKFVCGIKEGKILDRICEEMVSKSMEEILALAQQKEATLANLAVINKVSKSPLVSNGSSSENTTRRHQAQAQRRYGWKHNQTKLGGKM